MSGRLAGRWLSACVLLAFVSVLIAPLIAGSPATAQAVDPSRYDIGSPTLRDIWVDAARGSDSASGDSRAHALRTISAAWDIVPSGATLSGTGYRILLASGTYTSDAIPGWQEGHHGTGEFIRSGLAVASRSRATFKVNDVLGPGRQSSLELESDRPVVAERPMYFDYAGKEKRDWDGGHCVVGARGLATEYLFAEGTTRPGFDEWLTLQNPGDSAIEVRALYSFAAGQGAAVEKTYTVAAHHRRTMFVPAEVGADKDVAVKLTSSAQFLAERPMYFDYAGKWDGGHCLLGTSAHPTWYFAEGYTEPGFDEWLCLWNPGASAIDVEVTYCTQEAGALPVKTVSVLAGARLTIKVNDHAGPGYQLSAKLRAPSGASFVAERPMYFDYYGIDGGSVGSGL